MMKMILLLLMSAPPDEIMLFDLKPVGGDVDAARLMTSQLAAALESQGGRILTKEELNALISIEEARQVFACEDDAACVAESPLSERFKRVITGSIGRVGDQYLLNASLLDAEKAEPIARAGIAAQSLAELREALPEVARTLLGGVEAHTSSAAVDPDQRFVVLALEASGVGQEVAANLTEVVAVEVKRLPGSTVLSREDIGALIGAEQLKSVLTDRCDTSCMAEIAGALDARYLLLGRVGRLESTCVVSLTLLDQGRGELGDRRRAHEAFRGEETELIRAVRHATRRLIGVDGPGGAIAVSASEVGADVFVDHERVGTLPLPPKSGYNAGRHSVTVSKDGFFSWQTDVYVSPEETSVLWAELQAKPEHWYEKWWFWTIVGVAVAGATTAAIVATRPEPNSGSVGVMFE